MRFRSFLLSLLLVAPALQAQILTETEIHEVATGLKISGRPVLSSDGSFIVALSGGKLNKINLSSGDVKCIGEGDNLFNINIDRSGTRVSYIRPEYDENNLRHTTHESVDIDGSAVRILKARGRNQPSAVSDGSDGPVAAIDRGHLTIDGVAIDPLGKGSYLWPQVSPDGKQIVFWLTGSGCFVSDIDGSDPRHLGWMRAAVWAGDDLIIGMYDRDDGVVVTGSELVACDLKTGATQMLTSEDRIALFPAASSGRVAFVDGDGKLFYFDLIREVK